MNSITRTLPFLFISLIIVKPDFLKAQNKSKRSDSLRSKFTNSAKSPATAIDGTYELTERVMSDGTVLRPPATKRFMCSFVDGLILIYSLRKRMEQCRQNQPLLITLLQIINIASGLIIQ